MMFILHTAYSIFTEKAPRVCGGLSRCSLKNKLRIDLKLLQLSLRREGNLIRGEGHLIRDKRHADGRFVDLCRDGDGIAVGDNGVDALVQDRKCEVRKFRNNHRWKRGCLWARSGNGGAG
jgi:hypothetical protein